MDYLGRRRRAKILGLFSRLRREQQNTFWAGLDPVKPLWKVLCRIRGIVIWRSRHEYNTILKIVHCAPQARKKLKFAYGIHQKIDIARRRREIFTF